MKRMNRKSKRVCSKCGQPQPNPPIAVKYKGKLRIPCCFICGEELKKIGGESGENE